MIDHNLLERLRESKNLLAFSGGVDSTALFFALIDDAIDFDCAIVNYHTRENSDLEAAYAKELCDRYDKRLYTLDAKLGESAIEASARKIRYDFFETIVADHGYGNLITAHQLNDWLEWFLMQTCKGAGFFELSGMRHIEDRGRYRLIRPLLSTSRDEIEGFINNRKIKVFLDISNGSRRFLRNRFRIDFAAPLMRLSKEGIKRTFLALQNDRARFETTDTQIKIERLTVIYTNAIDAIRKADLALKNLGVLSSWKERAKLNAQKNFVAARKIAVCFSLEAIWIAPYEKAAPTKKFRERCRIMSVPPHIRPYLFNASIDLDLIDIFLRRNSTAADRPDRP
ncbi:MAG: tRNA lysidine(34) synthetase TilS [Helicobacteraceae bacterium]|jgi:tRNA(Ile)-lysidine synthase|nr:tRNA lysidine(34) synthetase TilS [Helicobacteraceae bacterium]